VPSIVTDMLLVGEALGVIQRKQVLRHHPAPFYSDGYSWGGALSRPRL